jgi:hypothetical protein
LESGFFGEAWQLIKRYQAFESFAAGCKLIRLNPAGEL